MREHFGPVAGFLFALALGGATAAALIAVDVDQPIAVLCAWIVFLGVAAVLAHVQTGHQQHRR